MGWTDPHMATTSSPVLPRNARFGGAGGTRMETRQGWMCRRHRRNFSHFVEPWLPTVLPWVGPPRPRTPHLGWPSALSPPSPRALSTANCLLPLPIQSEGPSGQQPDRKSVSHYQALRSPQEPEAQAYLLCEPARSPHVPGASTQVREHFQVLYWAS